MKQALDSDADEAVRWAWELADTEVEDSLLDLLVMLQDREQPAVRRIRAAFALNALGSSRSLPERVLVPALGAVPAIVREPDKEIRRNALVAISSLLHSSSGTGMPAKFREFADGLGHWTEQLPDEWEKRLLASAQEALSRFCRVKPDPALAKIVGTGSMPRFQVLKKVYFYIAKKGLSDKVDQTVFRTDSALQKVFGGRKKMRRETVSKLLEKHVS